MSTSGIYKYIGVHNCGEREGGRRGEEKREMRWMEEDREIV